MPIDSLSEFVSMYAPTIAGESDFTNVESSRGLGTDSKDLQLNSRSKRTSVKQEPAATNEVGGGSSSGAWETTLAKFEQTITEDRPRLIWLAQRVVRRREIAEEIVQESFLKAFRALPRFRGESRIRTWLCAIVRNSALEHLRNQREALHISLERIFEDDGMSSYDPPDARNNPESHYETVEMQTILRDELIGLGPYCKGAFQMCILDDNTQSEAATALNVSVGKIKSRVCRAKRILSIRVRRRVGLVQTVRGRDDDGLGLLGLE